MYSAEATQWLENIMRTEERVHIRHAENHPNSTHRKFSC